MAELKDLFQVYQEYEFPEKEIKTEPKKTSRLDNLNNYITRITTSKAQEPVKKESTTVETEGQEVQDEGTKYTRMVQYANNKSPLHRVMNFFINKGLTPEQASGFAGNFLAESDLNEKVINRAEKDKGYEGYGRGIAQWSNERVQQFQDYIGKTIEDSTLEEQLEFVWHETQQRPEFHNKLLSAKTSEEAADLVYRGYENGSINGVASAEQLTNSYSRAWRELNLGLYNFGKELRNRQNKAKTALTKYKS